MPLLPRMTVDPLSKNKTHRTITEYFKQTNFNLIYIRNVGTKNIYFYYKAVYKVVQRGNLEQEKMFVISTPTSKHFSPTDNLKAPSWSLSNETKLSYSNAPPITKLRIFLSYRKTKIYDKVSW